jgi:sRNA-binding carbon storage regulator CsrA
MLVLTVKRDTHVNIYVPGLEEPIQVYMAEIIGSNQVRLGFKAADSVEILRNTIDPKETERIINGNH